MKNRSKNEVAFISHLKEMRNVTLMIIGKDYHEGTWRYHFMWQVDTNLSVGNGSGMLNK